MSNHLLLARYHPPTPRWIIPVLAVFFACATIGRGLDYATGTNPGAESEIMMRALADLHLWGLALIVCGTFVLLAYASRRHHLIWGAHALAFALYLCVAITVVQSVQLAGDGYSAAIPAIWTLVWHAIAISITKPFPPRAAE